jgi:hypothetical protein
MSDRDAVRHSKGYQDLEIALRIHGRLLQELRSRLMIEERRKVEDAELIVTTAHEELLRLIFPQTDTASSPHRGLRPINGK